MTSPAGPGQPPGTVWNISTLQRVCPPAFAQFPCERQAQGGFPLILPSGVNTGRLVVFYQHLTTSGVWEPTETTWMGDPAVGWQQHTLFDLTSANEQISPFTDNDIQGSFKKRNFPSAAFDPRNPNVVYAIYAGVTASSGPGNVDLFIVKSTDGGATWPIQANRLHLTDAMLQDPANTDQFNPSISVSIDGALNVLYWAENYGQGDTPQPLLTPTFIRISNYTGPTSTVSLVYRLSTPFYPNPANGDIGEYQMLTAVGCYVYVCYMSQWDFYVSRFSLRSCLPADFDQNGVLSSADPLAFTAAFAAGDQRADLNRNSMLDTGDVERFCQSYSCGCNP
jgi:hypothetical protein